MAQEYPETQQDLKGHFFQGYKTSKQMWQAPLGGACYKFVWEL